MIDYNLISRALEFYDKHGYKRIEVPWWVSENISNITKPKERESRFILNTGKVLVASGEQGFLHLMNKSCLPQGKYSTVTPCFREDQNGIFYNKNFFKVELIDTINYDLNCIIKHSIDFFKSIATQPSLIDVREINKDGNKSFDIEYNGVEIGSYGERTFEYLRWVYGTGLAEPRFSKIEKSIENKELLWKNQ